MGPEPSSQLERLKREDDETWARFSEHIQKCTSDCSQLGLLCGNATELAQKLRALKAAIQEASA